MSDNDLSAAGGVGQGTQRPTEAQRHMNIYEPLSTSGSQKQALILYTVVLQKAQSYLLTVLHERLS